MRYQNWDALLFPKCSKAPLQEFRTACHIIQDSEFVNLPPRFLPTVTAFVPGLETGQPFRLSLHSWETPEPSRYCQSFTRHRDHFMFEARVFIDGMYTATSYFEQGGPWPAIIENAPNKEGNSEPLLFPVFHQEQISQNFWNAGDDMGRIKVVIGEGVFRGHLPSGPTSFLRVRNIVAFAFQHAPLGVLEACGIAWPNAAMWRQPTFSLPTFAQHISPRRLRDVSGSVIHTHSNRNISSDTLYDAYPAPIGLGYGTEASLLQRPGPADSFNEQELSRWRHISSDVSMPDCTSSTTSGDPQSRRITDPLGAGISETKVDFTFGGEIYERLEETCLPVPANTPQASSTKGAASLNDTASSDSKAEHQDESELDHDDSPESIGLSRPRGIVKSRKENMLLKSMNAVESSSEQTNAGKKAVQPRGTVSGPNRKRQRLTTPTSTKSTSAKDRPHSLTRSTKIPEPSSSPDNEENRLLRDIDSNTV